MEGSTCCSIHRHPGGHTGRTCRDDIQGVPRNSIQGHVGSTTCCSTHRLSGRAGGENMKGGHAGSTTREPEERDLCQRQLHPGLPRARVTAEDVQD